MYPTIRAIAGVVLATGATPALSAENAHVPPVMSRELTTDRPDATESPFTVAPGRLQLELNLLGWSRSRSRNGGGDLIEAGNANLRIGITNSLEFDVGLQPWLRGRETRQAPWRSGVGALTLRGKLNLWGNDSGTTAFAILPSISIPLDRGAPGAAADIEYGVLVPLAISLGEGLGLGLNTGLNLRRAEPFTPYRLSVPLTASLAVDLAPRLGSYFEIAAEVGARQPDVASFNSGLTWQPREDLQFDAGIGFGLNKASDRFAPFTGVSVRF